MGQPEDIAIEKQQLSGEDGEPQTSKADIFVNSTALVADGRGRVIRIFSVLQSTSPELTHAWVWVVATTIFCAWTVSFTCAVFISKKPVPHAYDFSPEITVALVNVAAHIAVQLTGGLVKAIFDALCWTVISGPNGAPLRTFLVTKQETGIGTVASLFLTYGAHQLWCILRFVLVAVGWVVGLLLLSGISYRDVYYPSQTINIVGGIAPLHESVMALEKANYGNSGRQPTYQDASINTMLVSSTNSILTDPKFVASVAPVSSVCKGTDCKSLFYPGGLELVLKPDGSSLFKGNQPNDPVIIVHDAPGYQIEFWSQNFTFNPSVDCHFYGLPVSALYACVASRNDTIFTGFVTCPFDLMSKGACQPNQSWTKPLAASVGMNIYRRMSTVAYDRYNFSILSVESLGPPQNAADEDSVNDLKTLFSIMYPTLTTIFDDIGAAIAEFNTGQAWTDLAYLASVYCLQAEITAAELFLKNGYPNWVAGQEDILEGFLAIPVQFGPLLLQQLDKSVLLTNSNTTASWAQVSFRVRSEPWTLITFSILVFGLVLWAILCLVYAHWVARRDVEQESSPTIEAAFENGNPFDAPSGGMLQSLSGLLGWIRGKSSPAPENPTLGGNTQVVARTVSDKILIAVDRKQD